MKVCEKVQRKGTTSYNEVADELVSEFTNASNHLAADSVGGLWITHGLWFLDSVHLLVCDMDLRNQGSLGIL